MQKASKKFDERIETINRIKNPKNPKRKKYTLTPQYDTTQMFELPVITNTLTTFPKEEKTPVRCDNLYSHHSNHKVQTELDSIISGALMHYKNQKINKIIFASPINNRLSLGKTYYRASRFASLDEPPSHYSEEASPRRRLRQGLDLTSLKLSRGSNLAHMNLNIHQVNQPNHNEPVTLNPSLTERNPKAENDFVFFYTASQEVPPPPQKRMRKTYIRPLNGNTNNKVKQEREARYSPWRNEDRDEELVI